MDSRIVNEKAAMYKDRSVRLTPALFDQLRIDKKSIQLKVDEFFIACIPFELSLAKASLLAFLSEQETVFFEKYVGKNQKLSITWNPPYGTRSETFFLVSRVLCFRKPDPASPYCFIDVEFVSSPHALKEMLVTYFTELDEAERFFKEAADTPLSAEQVLAAFGSAHLTLIRDGCVAERLKIARCSPRKIRAFGEFEGTLPAPGDILDLEPFEGEGACLIRGKCDAFVPYAEAQGFAWLDLTLEFLPCSSSRIRRAVVGNRHAPY
ncbi:MAG: hypothetical protein NT080_07495 [Spirochaetes bacterium]|nr:hypothetical protein [Spirochaetota bacterium]